MGTFCAMICDTIPAMQYGVYAVGPEVSLYLEEFLCKFLHLIFSHPMIFYHFPYNCGTSQGPDSLQHDFVFLPPKGIAFLAFPQANRWRDSYKGEAIAGSSLMQATFQQALAHLSCPTGQETSPQPWVCMWVSPLLLIVLA